MSKWTPDQDKFLRLNYLDIPTRDIAEFCGKTRNAVIGRAWRLGLCRKKQEIKKMKPVTWTPQMDDLLTELYKKATIREMTAILDVTYNQCAARIAKLGLKKPRKEKPNPPERIIEKVTCASVPVITPKLYRPEHIKHTGYTLKDISPQQCHWPLGDPKQPDFCYCGQGDVHKPYGYCKEHHELSIEKSNKVSKKLR